MSLLRVASGACIALIATCLLASCGEDKPEPLRPASEIIDQVTEKPIKPFPKTVLQPCDLPAEPVATIWPIYTPAPTRTWQCRVAPGVLADGKPVWVTYDIGGDLVSTAYYPDDSISNELDEFEKSWNDCVRQVSERGHPDATSTIDLGEGAFGYLIRRIDGTVEGEEGFAKVDGDLVGVAVISHGGRAPSVSVKDLLPTAIERARSGR